MAHNAPPSQDVQDIQFKLHDKHSIFPGAKNLHSLVSLLAVSSAKGLLFAGNPNGKELKVFKLRDVVDSKTTGQNLKVRVINLPGEPRVMACSCDGLMLAVNYVLNNTGFLQIYQVESFVTPTLNTLHNLPVAPENNVFALQLLWNPVISNNIALILTDGSVVMFTLNNGGQYDKVTLGKENQVKSGCWSPKGKQIVFGFAEGKLQQFKPNLQPARAITCPPGIHPGSFDCIAVHWLSTFQFAAIFLQRGQDMCPSLFIINAPKAGQPSYINYYDICYSAPGPRIQQLSFNHIAQWNLLLVTSANGVEVGVLGTKESGEAPSWIQYTLLDEARIEMPLTESKDETYPLGFAFDTASSHQISIGETKLPVMPMIHVLSTHGHLVSYNFLNLSPNVVDICSPPSPLNDVSGQFVALSETVAGTQAKQYATGGELRGGNKPQNAGDMTFTLGSNMVTSTPEVKDKPVALFSSQPAPQKPTVGLGFSTGTALYSGSTATNTNATANKPSSAFGFGATPAATVSGVSPFSQQFGGMTTGTPFGNFSGTGFTAKINESTNIQPPTQQQILQPTNADKNPEANKPLYTVPPTFTPPNVAQQQSAKMDIKPVKSSVSSSNKINLNTGEIDEVVKQMIVIQIEAFESEIRQIRQQSKQLLENIGSPDDLKCYTKQLNDLQEIIEQANDHEFEQDVQSLRHSMNESYAMFAECRTKLDLYNNPNLTRFSTVTSTDPTSRRQLAKLQAYVASNQNQLSQLNQLIDAQWSQYQDVVRRNSKNQMHIPCLDGIYQRMSKLKDLLSKQRTKMNYIKTKLKQKGLNYKPANDVDVTSVAVGALTKNQSTMESLADSILSMSLSQVVSQTHAKLSEDKLNAIRSFTKRQQQIAIVKPKRPDRVGLKSEVILETKLATERKQKEMLKKQQQQRLQQQYQQQQTQFAAYKTPINMQQSSVSSKTQHQQNYTAQLQQQIIKPQATISTASQQQQPILAKPTASKPSIVSSQPPTFITPTSSTAATLSFGGNSSFVKTSMSAPKSEEIPKPIATSTPFAGFGTTSSQTALNFTQAKPLLNKAATNDSKENQPITTPISFSAKVIGGNDAKPFANLGNKTTTQNNIMQPSSQGFSTTTSTGFSAFATTKPSSQTSSHDKESAKKSEEPPKPFGFGTASNSTTVTSAAPNAFTALGASAKTPSTTSLFGANTTTNTPTPFSTLSSSSPFSFNATATSPAASISTASNSSKPVTTTTASSQLTANPVETKTPTINSTSTTSTPATSTSASFSFNNQSAGNTTAIATKSNAAPNVTITSTGLPQAKPAAATPTPSNTPTPTATGSPTDSLLGSLNICKPTVKEADDSNKTENIFSEVAATTSTASAGSFSFASAGGTGDGTKSFLESTNVTGPSTGFSFVSVSSSTANAANVLGKPAATAALGIDNTTTTSKMSTTAVVTTAASAAPTANTASSFSFGTTATPSTAGPLFGSLSLSTSTAASTIAATDTTTTTTAAGNIFSGGSSVFGQATTAANTTSTSSIFGGGAAMASSAPSLFSSTAPTATTGSGSVFDATSPQTAGSIFAGIPKPEQSVFGAANTAPQPANSGLFAAAAANTKPSAATGGSIFGGGSSTGFGASAGGSIFGGGNAAASSSFGVTASANAAGSLFGAAAAATKPAEGGSIFGSPPQQSASSGGSIFGKNSFGSTAAPQSSGSIFGGSNAQSPNSGGFGTSGGSIFGNSNSANTSASGGSLFGAGAAATPAFGSSTTSPGFGSFSQPSSAPAFGSPSAVGFGAQAPTGFGSPQQQSAFAKPVFGGPATFGSPQPAFGAQPTFGGAPSFGSPKGFGSFTAASPPSAGFGAVAQGAAAPSGNIFETLGAQDSGLSFGNLAHSTQAPQQKPTFGGSSFMNYRS